MRYDIRQLLNEPVGATQYHRVGPEEALPQRDPEGRYWGDVAFLRTDTGILVTADLRAEVMLECSRCLAPFRQELAVRFDEEFLYGAHLPVAIGAKLVETGDVPSIGDDQILDLGEIIRQESLVQVPMQPMCKPDCAGLCPQCGADLREGVCGCEAEVTEARWAALEALKPGKRATSEGNM